MGVGAKEWVCDSMSACFCECSSSWAIVCTGANPRQCTEWVYVWAKKQKRGYLVVWVSV